ncbi:MAG TPA: hypothetical protein VN213_16860, partial [Solirubrobacteraceae bacterium]|nr:hypothetical protein [Solirubrobacteraceae bacterium]
MESELELPFAGPHRVCAPLLGRLEALPPPQQDALRVALGGRGRGRPRPLPGRPGDAQPLAEVAEEQPLSCLVDDVQWVDGASADVLGFVARRLLAVREPSDGRRLAGVPELRLAGLGQEDARALLATVVPGRLDEKVRDRIVAETGGNPLALPELPQGMSAAEPAGGFGLPGSLMRSGVEEAFQRLRLAPLPAATRRLLQLAAADPGGRAAARVARGRAAGHRSAGRDGGRRRRPRADEDAGAVRAPVHALGRLPVGPAGRTACAARRARQATDPRLDPDRRAWHRAQATPGPDEQVRGAGALGRPRP